MEGNYSILNLMIRDHTEQKGNLLLLPFSDLFPFNMYNLYFLFVAVLLQMTGMALVWKDVTWVTRLHPLYFEMYRDVCSFIDIGQPKWWWTIAINILWRSVSSKSISVFFYLSEEFINKKPDVKVLYFLFYVSFYQYWYQYDIMGIFIPYIWYDIIIQEDFMGFRTTN